MIRWYQSGADRFNYQLTTDNPRFMFGYVSKNQTYLHGEYMGILYIRDTDDINGFKTHAEAAEWVEQETAKFIASLTKFHKPTYDAIRAIICEELVEPTATRILNRIDQLK